jgi:hypothetical protein
VIHASDRRRYRVETLPAVVAALTAAALVATGGGCNVSTGRAQVGYLRLDVQARHSPPVDTPASAQTVVHYLLTWKVGPTSSPS